MRTGIAAFAAVATFSACGNSQFEWTEEVQLVNGDRLTTRRTAIAKPFGQIGGPGGWENEGMTLEIIAPVATDNPSRWSARFVPLIFDRDVDTKEWFIVATFYSCTSWYDLGRPKLPYTEFRFRNGRWLQQPLSASLIGRAGNMLTDVRSGGEPNHTLDSKRGRMNDPAISKRFKVVSETWTNNC